MSTTDAVMAINCAYTMFTNERSYTVSARRAIAERVCLPLIRECGQLSLQEFFSGRICEMMVILEAKLKVRICIFEESMTPFSLSLSEL